MTDNDNGIKPAIVFNPPSGLQQGKPGHKKTVSVGPSGTGSRGSKQLSKCATSVADIFQMGPGGQDFDQFLLKDQTQLKRDMSSQLKQLQVGGLALEDNRQRPGFVLVKR